MATKIVTKNSSTASAVPTASDLVQGELAVNVADKRLFTEDNGGSIVELGTNPYNFTANHNGSAKLATTSTGIDVTGTATMDGLTVDGDASISSANARLRLFETDTTDLNTQFQNQAGDFFIKTIPDDASSSTSRFGIDHSTGDISFYEDTGTTPKLFWDASAESLGIGTSSPAFVLDVAHASDNGLARFTSGDADAYITIGDVNSTSAHNKIGVITHDMYFNTNGSERMRIDSSGNLLVGTTDTSLWNDNADNYGHNILGNGQYYSSTNGEINAYLNRQNSDGAILAFAKDGTTVGSIGAKGGTAYFIGSSKGLRVSGSGLIPITTAGANSDATYDIGDPSVRFKDLYLSGGVYLGGTGAANKLDDYEEGTFTPTLIGSTTAGTGTYTIREGKYVIVGKMIYVSIRLGWSAHTGAGGMRISNLPNTANNEYANLGVVYRDGMTISSGHTVNVGVVPNQTYANILEIATSTDNASLVALDAAVTDIAVSGWYRIA